MLTSLDAGLLREAAMTCAMNPGVVQGLVKVTPRAGVCSTICTFSATEGIAWCAATPLILQLRGVSAPPSGIAL